MKKTNATIKLNNNEYFLGIDSGSASVGYAVTKPDYTLVRKNGKDLWGANLFDTANTAKDTRTHRNQRRRDNREKQRIGTFQDMIASEICKVDPGFFQRLKESQYYPEDKRDENGNCPKLPYALFVDDNYTDKEYHRNFPTISHLIYYLMTTSDTPDIRLVYLAISHMLKNRGHFLFFSDINQIKNFELTFDQFIQNVNNENLDWHIELTGENKNYIKDTLKNPALSKSVKSSNLIKQLNAKKPCEKNIIKLLTGQKVKLSDIFDDKTLDDSSMPKISFTDSDYDDRTEELMDILAEQYYIIASAKAVYDWAVLVDILGDSNSISAAKIDIYEKHRSDLKRLKVLIKQYMTKEDYDKVFVHTQDNLNNYSAYVGMTKKNGQKIDMQSKQCSKSDFYAFLKKDVIAVINKPEVTKEIEGEIDCERFLPKQTDKRNSVIPYQLYEYELKQIIKNLKDRVPFINDNSEKILQLFKFRVPYYVGPCNKVNDGGQEKFSWAVRNSDEKIYPWNFEEVIDVESSAEKFIRRMTNKCTYLRGEDVLPKDSLLYSKYMVLNELNNLKINNEKIPVNLKQKIYTDLFCKHRKVTFKKLQTYLKREGIISDNDVISGIDGDFKSSLKAYHDFKEKFTGVDLKTEDKERIVLDVMLFGADKKLLKQRIKRMYPNFTEKQINTVTSLSYSGWGRLSRAFLENIVVNETDHEQNIITALWETEDNLMQLLSQSHGFSEQIEKRNVIDHDTKITYKTVNDLYASPAVKRQLWHILKVTNEIVSIMGSAPKRIFLEMAREKQESKRTDSRKKQLEDLYKAINKECAKDPQIIQTIKELNASLETKDDYILRKDRVFLYYMQLGRDIYTGRPIPIEYAFNGQVYDRDHIYPQSKTADDSLDNKVLTKKEINGGKEDNYPINPAIQKKMESFWYFLLKHGLMSQKKYDRLTRKTPLTPDELASFINRQLVETRQATKLAADILKAAFPETEIVYVKANLVSQFRKKYDLLKIREMNDLHHAKDAYLNVVVGNAYYVKFTKNASWFIETHPGRTYNLQRFFEFNVVSPNGECAWDAAPNGTICLVKRIMNKNNVLLSYSTSEKKGELFKVQPLKKGKGQFPRKTSDERLLDIEKYGGYNGVSIAYFALVESVGKKNKHIRTVQPVPLYLKRAAENDEDVLLEYFADDKGLVEPHIIIPKIKLNTLCKVDGAMMYLAGKGSGKNLSMNNACQLILSPESTRTLGYLIQYINVKMANKNKDMFILRKDKLNQESLAKVYDEFTFKAQSTIYSQAKPIKNVGILLEKQRMAFISLTDEEKCYVLYQILHVFQCNPARADLKLINGSGEAGRIMTSSDISAHSEFKIIHKSITGFYEEEIDLLTYELENYSRKQKS